MQVYIRRTSPYATAVYGNPFCLPEYYMNLERYDTLSIPRDMMFLGNEFSLTGRIKYKRNKFQDGTLGPTLVYAEIEFKECWVNKAHWWSTPKKVCTTKKEWIISSAFEFDFSDECVEEIYNCDATT